MSAGGAQERRSGKSRTKETKRKDVANKSKGKGGKSIVKMKNGLLSERSVVP